MIELGGVPVFWNNCPDKLKVTVVNPPGVEVSLPKASQHEFERAEGDFSGRNAKDRMVEWLSQIVHSRSQITPVVSVPWTRSPDLQATSPNSASMTAKPPFVV